MARILPLVLLFAACTASVQPPAPPLRQDEPGEAARYYASKREGSDDPHRDYAIARERMRTMARYSTASDAMVSRFETNAASPQQFDRWQFLGPGNIGGRTRTLVIDPVQPSIMYAGGVSGGIWKTTDAGGSWTPIADDLANIAVNSLILHPTDRYTLYAGTGEGYFREEQRGTALPLRGNGIFVTHDAGATWAQLASTANEDFHFVNDLVISTHEPSRLYAATRTGVWRSADAGTTWTRVVATTVKGGCLDLAYRGDTAGDYLFASCGTFEQATVYRSKTAETNAAWTAVLSQPNMGRTSLAIAPSNPSIVYALSASNEAGDFHQGLLAVYRSTNDGDAGSWQTRVTNHSSDAASRLLLTNGIYGARSVCQGPAVPDVHVTMGWYSNVIAVDPRNPERAWAGGVDLFVSDDGGRTWGPASYWWTLESRPSFVHADQHGIFFHPHYDGAANRVAFFTNDGGVYRTDDALAAPAHGQQALCNSTASTLTFRGLNSSYGVTQFYHGAVFPDGRKFIAGAQDNGTLVGTIDGGVNGWVRVLGGDGGYVAVDPKDPIFVYAEAQVGNFQSSTSGAKGFAPAQNGLNDSFLFITPFALDPNHTPRLWIGGTRMWRTDDRAFQWVAASAPFDSMVSSIAIAPGDSNRVLAGTNSGDVYRTAAATTATGATTWIASRPRNGFVTSLAFDPANANIAYATYAGFGGNHVWRSLDGGATWAPLDGSGDGMLPDIPVHSLAGDPTRPGRLFLGTDLGVFVSVDGGAHWAVENTGFANAVTEAVFVGPGARGPAVYAFTHGRGAWRAELVMPGPRRRSVRK